MQILGAIPNSKDRRPTRRRNRLLIVGLTLLIGLSLLVGRAYQREAHRRWLMSEIRERDGVAIVDDRSLWQRLRRWYGIGSWSHEPTTVVLHNRFWQDPFDDAWIRDHDYLHGLQITTLTAHHITQSDLAALIDAHPVEVLNLTSSLLSDEAIAAIGRKPRLKSLILSHSDLDDAGLAALPLEQLELLHVTASDVTSAGLTELSRCRRLESVSLGADQLTAETARVLASLGTVKQFSLAGIEITDAHLELLQQISSLREVHLYQTRTSAAGKAALAAALPGCRIDRRR